MSIEQQPSTEPDEPKLEREFGKHLQLNHKQSTSKPSNVSKTTTSSSSFSLSSLYTLSVLGTLKIMVQMEDLLIYHQDI